MRSAKREVKPQGLQSRLRKQTYRIAQQYIEWSPCGHISSCRRQHIDELLAENITQPANRNNAPGRRLCRRPFLFSRCDKLLSDEGIGRENVLRGVRAPGACKSCELYLPSRASYISLAGSYIPCEARSCICLSASLKLTRTQNDERSESHNFCPAKS